jgi:hypothetical protein
MEGRHYMLALASVMIDRRHPFLRQIAVVVTVAALFPVSMFDVAKAGTPIPPNRVLSAQDKLERSISHADIVAVVRLLDAFDHVIEGKLRSGLRIEPLVLLKGELPLESAEVNLAGGVNSPVRARAQLLMRERPDPTVAVFLQQTRYGLFALGSSSHFAYGLPSIPMDSLDVFKTRVEEILTGQSLSALVHEANLVVIGTVLDSGSTCQAYGRRLVCKEVQVDSVLVGDSTLKNILVYSPHPADIHPSKVVLFLREDSDRNYEITAFRAGALMISDGYVPVLNESLEGVARSVRRLAKQLQLDEGGR